VTNSATTGWRSRGKDQLVAHRPAVDEEILPKCIGPGQRRRRGETFDHDAFALGTHFDGARAKLRAEDIAKPRQPAAWAGQGRRPGHRRAFLAGQCEGDVGARHREAAYNLADSFRFGAIGFEKFQARRRRVKQITDLDTGALRKRCRHNRRFVSAFDRQ
jgi:hypothetical protein